MKSNSLLRDTLVVVALFLLFPTARAEAFTFTTIDVPGASDTLAFALMSVARLWDSTSVMGESMAFWQRHRR